ncbi:MAG: hypothetical protein LH606_12485 [Cytophagaceae bacterium]|nr:hypothetical protein [Cytophagaceae bacterium]
MNDLIEFKLFVLEELPNSSGVVRLRWIVSPPSSTVTLEAASTPELGFETLATDQTAVRTYRDQPAAPRYYRLRVGSGLSEVIKGNPLLPDWAEKVTEPKLSPQPAPAVRLGPPSIPAIKHKPTSQNQSWGFWLLLLGTLAGIGLLVALMIDGGEAASDSQNWLTRPEWLSGRTATGEFTRKNGTYEIQPTSKSAARSMKVPFDFSKNFAVEVTVESLGDELPWAGLNLDIDNEQSYLTLRMNSKGQFYFQQFVEGDRYYAHRRGYLSTVATKFSGVNTLRIERHNESLRALINGQIVAREKQFLSGSRRVGLVAFGSGARFSDLHIVAQSLP